MSWPRMRPSFRVGLTCPADDFMVALRSKLQERSGSIEGELSSKQALLRIPGERRRIWSPCLDISVKACDPDEAPPAENADTSGSRPGDEFERDGLVSRLYGTFSPRPEIWTALVFAMGTLIIIGLFSSLFGIAQWILGRTPSAFMLLGGAVGGAAGLYVSALVGQGLSIADLYELRAFVDACQREAEAKAPKPR